MKNAYKNMRTAVFVAPHTLLSLPDKLKRIANDLLPYSTGIEIECRRSDSYKLLNFTNIPNIISIDNDDAEQRYHIPKGIKGMICLWEVCEQLQTNSLLDESSGIHYHIDMTDVIDNLHKKHEYTDKAWHRITNPIIIPNNDWILKSLESWNYTGKYNDWRCSDIRTAVRYSDEFNTLEIRIGEMTFDYEVILNRILHSQRIVRKLKRIIYTKARLQK
jgi:hypothetical protein